MWFQGVMQCFFGSQMVVRGTFLMYNAQIVHLSYFVISDIVRCPMEFLMCFSKIFSYIARVFMADLAL